MKNKRKLNFLRILLVLSLVFSLLNIRTTYAKYMEDFETNYKVDIKRWRIKLKNTDINEKESITEALTPVFESNYYINDGVIAPTSKGYFDIWINFSEVDLKFNFELDIGQADMLDYKIYGYEMSNKQADLDGEGIIYFTEDDIIEGGIELDDTSTDGTEDSGTSESGSEATPASEEETQTGSEESGDDGSGDSGTEDGSDEEVVEDTYTEGETDAKRIKQTIDPTTETIKMRYIRLYFDWYDGGRDGEIEYFSNESDAAFTIVKGKVTYRAIMRFEQYVEE